MCEAEHKTGAGNTAGAGNKADSGVWNIAEEEDKVGVWNNSVSNIWPAQPITLNLLTTTNVKRKPQSAVEEDWFLPNYVLDYQILG